MSIENGWVYKIAKGTPEDMPKTILAAVSEIGEKLDELVNYYHHQGDLPLLLFAMGSYAEHLLEDASDSTRKLVENIGKIIGNKVIRIEREKEGDDE